MAVLVSHTDVGFLASQLAKVPASNTSQQREVVRKLLSSARDETIFDVYGLSRTVEVVETVKAASTKNCVTYAEIERRFRNLARHVHPDKNGGDESATAAFKFLVTAKEILMNPKFLRKYRQRMAEVENQRRRDAGEDVNSHRWWGIGISILCGLVIVGLSVATGGVGGVVCGIIGSGIVGAGTGGGMALIDNPNISDDELWQQIIKGGVSGAAGGAVGAAAAPLVAAAAAGGAWGVAGACAGTGAVAALTSKAAEDGVEMYQGERELREFSSVRDYAKAAIVGGVAGGVAGGLGHKFCPADVIDDVAGATRRLQQTVGDKAIKAGTRSAIRAGVNITGAAVGQVAGIAEEAYHAGGLDKVDWEKAGQRALLGGAVAAGSAVATSIGEQAMLDKQAKQVLAAADEKALEMKAESEKKKPIDWDEDETRQAKLDREEQTKKHALEDLKNKQEELNKQGDQADQSGAGPDTSGPELTLEGLIDYAELEVQRDQEQRQRLAQHEERTGQPATDNSGNRMDDGSSTEMKMRYAAPLKGEESTFRFGQPYQHTLAMQVGKEHGVHPLIEPVTPVMLDEELDVLLAQIARMVNAYTPSEGETMKGPVRAIVEEQAKQTPEYASMKEEEDRRMVACWTESMAQELETLKAHKADIQANYDAFSVDTQPKMIEANKQLQRLEALLQPQQKALPDIPPLDTLQKWGVAKLSKLADRYGRDSDEDDEDDAGLKGEIIAWLVQQSSSCEGSD